ncbi:MAG TPA: shikimate kinase [Nitriliruptoraceae bacterium]|nr:shikimate kinase [Nitriliruptoraceae bacterium]
MSSTSHVVVVGQMGVGKSTLAQGLADALGRKHLDSDVWIEEATGVTGREVARRDGVDALHDLEVATLVRQLREPTPAVVSAAAAVVDDEAGRDVLEAPVVVWLDLSVEALMARLELGRHRRRIAAQEMRVLDARRRPLLEAIADHRLDGGLAPDELLARALAVL